MGVYERYLQKMGKQPLRLWGPESKYGRLLKNSTYDVWPDAGRERFSTASARFKPAPERLALHLICGIIETKGDGQVEGVEVKAQDEILKFSLDLKKRVSRVWIGRIGNLAGNQTSQLIEGDPISKHMIDAINLYRARLAQMETRLTHLPLDFMEKYTQFTEEEWKSQVFQHPDRHRELERLIFNALRIESIKVDLLHLPAEYDEASIASGFDAPDFAISLTKQRHTVSAVAGFLRFVKSSAELFVYLDCHTGDKNIWEVPGKPGIFVIGKEALIKVAPA